jgi:lipopolysaccharide transport system permease protein
MKLISADRPVKVIRPAQSSMEMLFSGLVALWSHRGLLVEMTLLRLRTRYRQSLLGWLWAILPPLVLTITYTLVFAKAIGLTSGDLPYSLFILSALVPWMYFSSSVSTAAAGVVTHRYLVSRVAFPREIIPLSYVAAALLEFGIGMLMLAIVMYYYGVSPTLNILYTIPLLGILVICSTAAALVLSALQARIRDVGLAMPLMLQVLMFTAPVVYSSVVVPESISAIYSANPLAILMQAFRQSTALGVSPDAGELIYCAAVSIVCLICSYVLFKRLDLTLADVI